jgi:hypothetical protein
MRVKDWVLVVVAAVALIALPLAAWGLRVQFADVIGLGNARIQIQSAPYRITAYDHFFNLCVSVQANEASLDAQMARLEGGPSNVELIETNIAALEATRGRAIAQYNGDATKDYTIGQFRDSGLPYRLDTAPYTGVRTQCAA